MYSFDPESCQITERFKCVVCWSSLYLEVGSDNLRVLSREGRSNPFRSKGLRTNHSHKTFGDLKVSGERRDEPLTSTHTPTRNRTPNVLRLHPGVRDGECA